MITLAHELDEKLRTLDAKAAGSLERLVRNALDQISTQNESSAVPPTHRLPDDFFKKIAQEFGPGPFERLPQGDFEQREAW